MPAIGVRDLREQTSEVLRQVQEAHAEYIITYQGRPVLTPTDALARLAKLAKADKRRK